MHKLAAKACRLTSQDALETQTGSSSTNTISCWSLAFTMAVSSPFHELSFWNRIQWIRECTEPPRPNPSLLSEARALAGWIPHLQSPQVVDRSPESRDDAPSQAPRRHRVIVSASSFPISSQATITGLRARFAFTICHRGGPDTILTVVGGKRRPSRQ